MSESTVDLKESVARIAVSKAYLMLEAKADQYDPIQYACVVVSGIDINHMEEDESGEEYCEKCINHAVAHAYEEYIKKRREFMGRIYEINRFGYSLDILRAYDDDDKFKGYRVKKERIPGSYTKDGAIKELEARLKKEYPGNKIFKFRTFDISGSETTNFKYCNDCGEVFAYIPLINNQELEHWESVSDDDLKDCIKNPRDAYQLHKIFDHCDHNTDLYYRAGALAARIINLNS